MFASHLDSERRRRRIGRAALRGCWRYIGGLLRGGCGEGRLPRGRRAHEHGRRPGSRCEDHDQWLASLWAPMSTQLD